MTWIKRIAASLIRSWKYEMERPLEFSGLLAGWLVIAVFVFFWWGAATSKRPGGAPSTESGMMVIPNEWERLPPPPQDGRDPNYAASNKSTVYHRPSCKWVAKIKDDNLVTFATTRAAEAAGLRPCKVCRP